jgi:hypothetical protein
VKRLAPGMYLDEERNELHFSAPEMLEGYGYVDTPANREILLAEMRKTVAREFPGVPITEED